MSDSKLTKEDYDNKLPPEGGTRAWLVLCAAATIMALSFGMCNSFGVYQTHYEEVYSDVKSNIISIIGCLQVTMTFFLAVPSTMGMHLVGGQQLMVLIGGVMAILGFMFLSITNELWQVFLAQGLLFGMGSGIMYVHSTGVTFQYFDKRKALAQGIITSGASLGGVYWPIGVRNLINKVGFGWANRIIGFIYIPMVLFAVLFLKPRLKLEPRKEGENITRVNFKVLRNWKFVLLSFSWFTFMMSLFPGMFYIDLFCIRAGVTRDFQLYSVAIINASALVSRLLSGFIGDIYGRMNLLIPFLLLSGIFPLTMWLPQSGQGLKITFIICWSFVTGAPVSLYPTIIGQLFKGPNIYSYLSIFFVFGGIGSFIGPIIGGDFIPSGGKSNGIEGFNKLSIFCGVLSLFSCILVITIRLVYSKRVLFYKI